MNKSFFVYLFFLVYLIYPAVFYLNLSIGAVFLHLCEKNARIIQHIDNAEIFGHILSEFTNFLFSEEGLLSFFR